MTWLRKHKKYKRPKKPFDKQRIDEEKILVKNYGLKNKKEIWKAEAEINKIRGQAKKLITAKREEQEKLFKKLGKIGFIINEISDVLSLKKEDWLKRRLQSVLVDKKIAKNSKQARQLIVHKHIKINSQIVNIPSYIVKVNEEDKIGFVKTKTKSKVKKIKDEQVVENKENLGEENGEKS